MKTTIVTFSIILLGVLFSNAQFSLKPSIGLNALPNDNDSVCSIPLYLSSNFDTTGYYVGDTIAYFKLYDLNGDSLDILEELQDGIPILLLSANYTCPYFRNKINEINLLAGQYSSSIKVFIIYTIEAHPDIDISPYFGIVNTTNMNYSDNILYRQPTTYGEKKSIVSDMLNAQSITPKVFIDGPCNYWHATFGPGPNIAYLINTDGTVFSKHGWFNQAPLNMSSDIDSLLGNSSVHEQNANSVLQQQFNVYYNFDNHSISFSALSDHVNYSFELYNSCGNLIFQKVIDKSNVQEAINLSRISSQLMFYRAFNLDKDSGFGNKILLK